MSSGTSIRKKSLGMHEMARKQAIDFDPTWSSIPVHTSSSHSLSSAYGSGQELLNVRTRLQGLEGNRNSFIDSPPDTANEYLPPLSSSISKSFSTFRRQRGFPKKGKPWFCLASLVGLGTFQVHGRQSRADDGARRWGRRAWGGTFLYIDSICRSYLCSLEVLMIMGN